MTDLLLYVAHAADRHTPAVGAALAAASARAGVRFDCYYDRRRSGRHFGGGDPETMGAEEWAGSLVAGARHLDQVLWLSTVFHLVAAGDPASPLWPVLDAAGAECLVRSTDPATVFAAVFDRLGFDVPSDAAVLDAQPQGPHRVVTAPYLAPALLAGPPRLAVDVSCDDTLRESLAGLGVTRCEGLYLDAARASAFPGGLDARHGDVGARDYAAVTTELARRHASWGEGTLLGGPDLVAAQLPKLARLRLVPIHGRPQTDCLARVPEVVRAGREPVYGVQYDDHDFFALARLGHGLQVLDPDPPFDAVTALPARVPVPPVAVPEPSDDELRTWADEGRVLVTLVFWGGMVRELDCITRVLDLVGLTGLRAGLAITAETLEHGGAHPLSMLATPVDRGGALGALEPLLACTGRGVAAEGLMPAGTLAASLSEAAAAVARVLPPALTPRGWWPLLDTSVRRRRMPIGWRDGRPVLFAVGREPALPDAVSDRDGARAPAREGVDPHGEAAGADVPGADVPGAGGTVASAKELLRTVAQRSGLRRLFGHRRPYDAARPGTLEPEVVSAVRAAGLSYLFTKSAFGRPTVPYRDEQLLAVPFTAGRWDGWSPFYTLSSTADFVAAERRLLRSRRPGWLASTIDTPLWAMSGEIWAHGTTLHEIADLAARGGRSGRLVNTTPHVVARYARLLDERGLLD